MQFGTVLYRIEFGDGFDMGEERDYLFGHLLTGKSQVDYVLQEGKEDEGGGYRAGFDDVFEESETDLIREDRQLVVLKYL